MGRGRREEVVEKKLNIKKVILVIAIISLVIICVLAIINKDKIFKALNNEEISLTEEVEENEKTVEDILADFGGEIIEQPKSDTYIVLKDDKHYTIYSDGEIIEEKISFWNGQSSKPAIDEAGNYNIYSEEELKWIADMVINGEENFSNVTITLRSNLDFGARIKEDGTWEGPVWTSIIGFLDELQKEDDDKKDEEKEEVTDIEKENLKRFAGCLNGNGFSIRGIYVESDKNYQGLFGYSSGTIENLTLKNSYISGNSAVGAIVGLNGGIVRNCSSINTIVNGKDSKIGGIVGISMSNSTITQSYTGKGEVTGKQYVGGIAGYVNNNANVLECTNTAKVTGDDNVGGIAGIAFFGTIIQTNDNSGKINGGKYTGGIVGFSEAQLEKVNNRGEVTGKDFVGGIAGANFTMGNISKSYNTGKIIGNNNIGGIVGSNNAATSNCYNTGNIKSEGYRVGGICGQNASKSSIYNCYNIGVIEGNEDIGGIVGGDFGSTTNCYYLDEILKDDESSQGKTEEELKNNVLESLGEEFLVDTNQVNQGYPILGWQI